jgi:hypothetical protein
VLLWRPDNGDPTEALVHVQRPLATPGRLAVGHAAYRAFTGQWRPPSMCPRLARKQPCGQVPGFLSAGHL